MACIMGVSTSMKRRSCRSRSILSAIQPPHRGRDRLTLADVANRPAALPQHLPALVIPQHIQIPHTGPTTTVSQYPPPPYPTKQQQSQKMKEKEKKKRKHTSARHPKTETAHSAAYADTGSTGRSRWQRPTARPPCPRRRGSWGWCVPHSRQCRRRRRAGCSRAASQTTGRRNPP